MKNLLMCGDNLLIMKKIIKEYQNKVDLIYIDPPYNTGKIMGKYNDNFKSHNEWISFMKPRLELAKDFLSESGVIFISIGEKEEAHLKLLCDDIFGENNKLSTIIWQCKHTVSNDKKSGISSQTEYILLYAKNIKEAKINPEPLNEEYVKKMYKNIDNDPRGPWRGGVQLYKKKNKEKYTVISPTGKKWTMPWNYSRESWNNKLVKNDLIYWGKDGYSCPVKKVFLKDNKGTIIKNLWLGKEAGYTADGGDLLEEMLGNRNDFLYPKPLKLMKKIIKIGSSDNSLVMDFFAGSGTFGHAVLTINYEEKTNRRFILISNNDNNIFDDVLVPRIKKSINGYRYNDKIIEGLGGEIDIFRNKK